MTELGTALRELADQHQRVSGPDPSDLWNRGRQRVLRRRVLVGVTVAALAIVVGGLGVAGPEPRLISPAGQPHAPGIPSNVEDPPSWLPVAEYGTKVGPLSVLGRAMRHGRMELFGINAETGKYRFLPNGEVQIPGTPVALSPNGRYVAYWAGSDGKRVTSLTVFDTVIGTESGLSLGEDTKYGYLAGPLTWLDDKTVLLAFDVKSGPGDLDLGSTATVETFGTDGTGPDEVTFGAPLGSWSRARDGSLLAPTYISSGLGRWAKWRSLGTDLRVNGPSVQPPRFSRQFTRSGELIVGVGSIVPGEHLSLVAGRVAPHLQDPTVHDVGDLYVGTLLGWTSADSVLVTGWQHAPNGQASLFEANVRTGKVKLVGDAGDDTDVVLAVASDLLEKPLVSGHPPHGINPEIIRFGGAAALFIVAVGLLLWRRRART